MLWIEKKLISISYVPKSKNLKVGYKPTQFETSNPIFDVKKTGTNGKVFTLKCDMLGVGKIEVNDFEWDNIEGDDDFRYEEFIKLRIETE